MLWTVLWRGHPDQRPPSAFPDHLSPSPVPPSRPRPPVTPCPVITLPPAPHHLPGPSAPAGAEWQQTQQLAWPRAAPWCWPWADGRVGPGLAFPSGPCAGRGMQLSSLAPRGHSLRGRPVPTGRAARRHLLHSCDEDAGAGTTAGGLGPGEATGAPGGTRVLLPLRRGLHGTLAGWGGSVSRAFGLGSAKLLPRVRGAGQELGWPGSQGADPARTG